MTTLFVSLHIFYILIAFFVVIIPYLGSRAYEKGYISGDTNCLRNKDGDERKCSPFGDKGRSSKSQALTQQGNDFLQLAAGINAQTPTIRRPDEI